MRTAALNKIKPLFKDPIPPIDPVTQAPAVAVGITDDGSGRVIYATHILDQKASQAAREQVMNPLTGAPVYRKDAMGELYPVYKRAHVFKPVKITIRRKPNACNKIEIYREPNAVEREADAKKRAVIEFQQRLAEAATEQGVTPEQMVEQFLATVNRPRAQAEPEVEQPTIEAPSFGEVPAWEPEPNDPLSGVHVVPVGGGWYNVEVQGQPVSEKTLRKEDAEKLAAEYREGRESY